MVELDNPFTKNNHASTIISCLTLEPKMTIIDIGCGPGRITIPLAQQLEKTLEITAMDLQQGMLEKVKTKAAKLGLKNIQFLQKKIRPGVLQKNYYDRALLVSVLGEIPEQDKEKSLRAIYDALKPGGILVISEIIFDPHFQNKKKIRNLALKAGFRESTIFGYRLAFTVQFKKD